ncbi:MAG: 23S rRNA (uracil(1939)-C(5))-methyltransferase RlmD [Acidobacteria bacterium]|nr:23S rRNA (uracil(1939)-C(5))-methyltransferase RlmD [Acidobacteriota bacterium]
MANEFQSTPNSLDISIEKMVYGGEGLARTPEGVLLVPLVLPGERVRVEAKAPSKGVRRARLLEVIEPSPVRVAPGCPYFTRCGGCQYQHIGYAQQLTTKQEILLESFERVGKLHLDLPISAIASEPWQYRNRTRLRTQKQQASFQIGYYELLTHDLCPIDHCPISSPLINDAIGKLAGGLGAALFPDGDAEIELFVSDSDQKLIATVYSNRPAPRTFGDALREAMPAIQSVCCIQKPDEKRARAPKPIVWGDGYLAYHVGEYHFRIGHESFFQINRFLLEELIRTAIGDLQGERALDLYAGVGLFTLPLAHRFQKVAAVESSAASARDLESNVGVVSAKARAYHMTAEKFLATALPKWDIILVDPPRTGLSKTVLENCVRLRPRRFVYVSCDPTTLARDIAVLTGSGYRIRAVHLMDQFPQTFHIETVVQMERLE